MIGFLVAALAATAPFGVLVALGVRRRSRARRLAALAQPLELEIDPRSRGSVLRGNFRRWPVRLWLDENASSIRLEIPLDVELPAGMRVERRGERAGGLRVGDAAFDRAAYAEADHPAAAIRVLREPGVAARLATVLERFDGELDDSALSVALPFTGERAELSRAVGDAVEAARAVAVSAAEERATRERALAAAKERGAAPELPERRFVKVNDPKTHAARMRGRFQSRLRGAYAGAVAIAAAGPTALLFHAPLGWAVAALLLGVGGVGVTGYRCPACELFLADAHGRIDFHAEACPSCGQRLR